MIRLIIEAITQVARAAAEALGLATKRTDLNNQADVKRGAENVSEAKEREKDIAATADIDEERKRSAE